MYGYQTIAPTMPIQENFTQAGNPAQLNMKLYGLILKI